MGVPLFLLLGARGGRPLIEWSLLGGVPNGLSFARASGGSYWGGDGLLKFAGDNEPRFDHDPVTGVPRGLLMEGARTFVSRYGDDPRSWSNQSTTRTNVDGVFLGIFNKAQRVASTGADWNGVNSSPDLSSSETVSVIVYALKGSSGSVRMMFRRTDAGNVGESILHGTMTDGGSLSSTSAGISPGSFSLISMVEVQPDIFEIKGTFVPNAAIPSGQFRIGPSSNTAGEDIIILGVSIERGAFPSSFANTFDSNVTRAQDNLSNTSIPWFNPAEGTYLLDWTFNGTHGLGADLAVLFDDGSLSNRWGGYRDVDGRFIQLTTRTGSTSTIASAGRPDVVFGQQVKKASAVNSSGSRTYWNGSSIGTTNQHPLNIAALRIGNRGDGARPVFAHIRGFKYWNRALGNDELERITT